MVSCMSGRLGSRSTTGLDHSGSGSEDRLPGARSGSRPACWHTTIPSKQPYNKGLGPPPVFNMSKACTRAQSTLVRTPYSRAPYSVIGQRAAV